MSFLIRVLASWVVVFGVILVVVGVGTPKEPRSWDAIAGGVAMILTAIAANIASDKVEEEEFAARLQEAKAKTRRIDSEDIRLLAMEIKAEAKLRELDKKGDRS